MSKRALLKIAQIVRDYPGITRKKPIADLFRQIKSTHIFKKSLENFGDDAAVIPWSDGYLLMAADGMMSSLVLNEPYAAGKAAVMATVNDIYAMGGRPLGLVNVLASGDETQRKEVIKGIEKGCTRLKVPMLGGHLHPDAPVEMPMLSVAILGSAKSLLRCHLAEEDDDIILAVDLDGRPGCSSVKSWDANSGKSAETLTARLEAMPIIAEKGLARAAKDVSNGGILGTVSIMVENSNRGAEIQMDRIPVPGGISFEDWLLSFLSFGFVIAAPQKKRDEIFSIFNGVGITSALIGKVTRQRRVLIKNNSSSVILFDFEKEYITGIHRKD